jgi:hypothetical protein
LHQYCPEVIDGHCKKHCLEQRFVYLRVDGIILGTGLADELCVIGYGGMASSI